MSDNLKLGRWLLVGTVACGILFIFCGFSLPVYTDIEAARQIKADACDANGVIKGWWRKLAAVTTLRHDFMQGGASLILFSVTAAIINLKFADEQTKALRTPAKKSTFFLLGSGAITSSWFAQIFSLDVDMRRGEFAWCADTIGIPIAGLTTLYFFLLAAGLVGGIIISMFFKPLPTKLFVWNKARNTVSLFWAVLFGALALLTMILAVASATGSSFLMIPSAVIVLYLLVATHAALTVEPEK